MYNEALQHPPSSSSSSSSILEHNKHTTTHTNIHPDLALAALAAVTDTPIFVAFAIGITAFGTIFGVVTLCNLGFVSCQPLNIRLLLGASTGTRSTASTANATGAVTERTVSSLEVG